MSRTAGWSRECNFVELRDAGDPVEAAEAYDAQGADELIFLDITASSDKRNIILDVVGRTAERVFMPLTVGGGMRTVRRYPQPAQRRRRQGVHQYRGCAPPGIREGGGRTLRRPVHRGGHRRPPRPGVRPAALGGLYPRRAKPTGIDAVEWAQRMEAYGAGEILLTTMDCDGTKDGYDIPLTRAISDAVRSR